jgi:hypothetical protein
MATYSSFKRINTEAIVDGAVSGATLGTNSIVTAAFDSASVRTTDIQDSAVGTTQLASNLNLSGKTVTYRPIINADIAAAAIAGGQLASGAIAANIGYTPANLAGATLSGALQLPTASAGAPSLASSSDTNTGIHFAGSDHGGWYYANSFGGVNRWTELNNLQPGGGWTWQVTQKGGSNMSSNGRFTAPVAGWYSFYCQTYAYNDTNNSAGYTHWNIGYNGSIATDRVTGRVPHTLYGHQVSANHVPGIMTTLEIYLNASDYAIPQPYMASSIRFHGDHSLWCGYLIG